MKAPLFANRFAAGRDLAGQLTAYEQNPDVLVLALPRGGVPVGFEIAKELKSPLDVFIVRKLGVPGYEELALGAIASGGVRVLNPEVVQHLGISQRIIEAVTREQLAELNRRETLYRGGREPALIEGRRIILIDDGLATGSSMRAAVLALRQRQPRSITVAVPVAAPETCNQFRHEVEEVVCAKRPTRSWQLDTGTRILHRRRTRKFVNCLTAPPICAAFGPTNNENLMPTSPHRPTRERCQFCKKNLRPTASRYLPEVLDDCVARIYTYPRCLSGCQLVAQTVSLLYRRLSACLPSSCPTSTPLWQPTPGSSDQRSSPAL